MINSVRLQNFRSYTDASFEFDDGVNIIVGANTSGKTNLLEAILTLCKGGSYRATDKELINFEKPWAKLDSQGKVARSVTWQYAGERLNKEFKIGGSTFKRLPAVHKSPVVLFEPSHMKLLTESPDLRRQLIDDILEQIDPNFDETRRHYKRALAQRNSALKRPNQDLFVWDVQLSELGAEIAKKRNAFLANNAELLKEIYSNLAGKKSELSVEYITKITGKDYASTLLKKLQGNYEIDYARGFTTHGPHRDDMVPVLNGHHLADAGSRGETRTTLLALKLLEARVLEQAKDQKPILLLDDVFSELDGSRRRALTVQLKNHQTFITTTDADIVVQHFLGTCRVIPLEG